MTAATSPADAVPTPSAWRRLPWIVPVAVLWFVVRPFLAAAILYQGTIVPPVPREQNVVTSHSNGASRHFLSMKLRSLFLGIILASLPMSPETAQQFDSACNDGADLAVQASEIRQKSDISIDTMLSRAYEVNRPRYLGAKIDPDPIFSEVSLEAILFAYSSDTDDLTGTQVHERFYAVCRERLNSESDNEP
jgi:hypothetical protein